MFYTKNKIKKIIQEELKKNEWKKTFEKLKVGSFVIYEGIQCKVISCEREILSYGICKILQLEVGGQEIETHVFYDTPRGDLEIVES